MQVSEFVERGDLKSLIFNDWGIDLETKLRFSCEMIQAISYLHSLGFIHYDIKPSNFFITEDMKIKLAGNNNYIPVLL